MRLLLDTHALIWHQEGSYALSAAAKKMIENDSNRVFISIATIWEMSIKTGLGKLELSLTIPELLDKYSDAGAKIVSITPEHAMASGKLPWHHRDLFDRMLIAQAQQENMTIVTCDALFSPYSVARVW